MMPIDRDLDAMTRPPINTLNQATRHPPSLPAREEAAEQSRLFVLIGGGTLQIAAIVAGAMVAAVALGGSVVLVSETAVSALLVVTIHAPSSGLSGLVSSTRCWAA
jgi:hypothetical protein